MAREEKRPLLQVEGLSVAFGWGENEKRVVDAVSFAIEPGEKWALVGESGSGKSVTAAAILRLHDPHSCHYPQGAIHFCGEDLLRLDEEEMRRRRGNEIAMIFQEPMSALNPLYTIGDQLREPLRLHRQLGPQAAEQRAIEMLERVGIPEPQRRLRDYPHQLSGGQLQRVMIAMALACQPRLLIADEPTTALDVTIQIQILELLDQLQREEGMAVLLISHDLNLVHHFAHNIAVMERGKIVEQGARDHLFHQPQHPYTQRLIASEPQPLSTARERYQEAAPLLRAENIRCHFQLRGEGLWRRRKARFTAVDGVSLQLHPGETLGIVGESGSGKTTLGMSLLCLQQSEGEILFDGRSLQGLKQGQLRPLRRHFQVVFQDPFSSLSPRMTVESI
ncbi:MAG: ABC transporter ATP-binding protein, partial [Gammaproteobacteria bacterium]|nr:ABC transporter ATP-binding protein [Gammaproteobacteria bacterium]